MGTARLLLLIEYDAKPSYQMIEIYVFFPPCFTVHVRDRKLGARGLKGRQCISVLLGS